MSGLKITSQQLQQIRDAQPLASGSDTAHLQAQAKSILVGMADSLIGKSGQIKSGYLRLKLDKEGAATLKTNRWQRSSQTDAATDTVRKLITQAYGQNEQVTKALDAYLKTVDKNNKLGSVSFIKLVRDLDSAATGHEGNVRINMALQGRVGSLDTHLFAESFRVKQLDSQLTTLKGKCETLSLPAADFQERRELISELITLRESLTTEYSNYLTDNALKRSVSMLQLEVERTIEQLIDVQCKGIANAVMVAQDFQADRNGKVLDVLQSLQVIQHEIISLRELEGQAIFPILALKNLDLHGLSATHLVQRFTGIQAERRNNPQAALIQAGVPTALSGAQEIAQNRDNLTALVQTRRQTLWTRYAQADFSSSIDFEKAQAIWNEQTAPIEELSQSLLTQIESQHSESKMQLESVCFALREDMGDGASLQQFDDVTSALLSNLDSERDRLLNSVRDLTQDRLGQPRLDLAKHLSRDQWNEAAALFAATQPTPDDLAQVALVLKMHTQPDRLVRFMKAIVPEAPRNQIEFLKQVFSRDDSAVSKSEPYMACMAAMEKIDSDSSKLLMAPLILAVGQHNPGTSALAAGADAQVLRLDQPQRLQSARHAIVSVASPGVALQGADLRNAFLHIEYRREHAKSWAPNLSGAQLDQARIELDFSDLPYKTNSKTKARELDFNSQPDLLRIFGFEKTLNTWRINAFTNYSSNSLEDIDFIDPFDDNLNDDQLPDALRLEVFKGPPVVEGLYSILNSISPQYPQQRKEVACQLLDLALQVPFSLIQKEKLLDRSPLFIGIRQDSVLMADSDVAQRLNSLSSRLASTDQLRA